jgi:hypothetical protein
MKLNFYGFDPSYHVARYHFVHRLPHAWTPLHLARHRRQMWQKQAVLMTRDAAPPAPLPRWQKEGEGGGRAHANGRS